MGTNRNAKGTEATLAEQLSAGAKKFFANSSTLSFASSSFTPAQVEAQLTLLASLRNDVDTAKAALQAKLAAETAQLPALRTFMRAFVRFVKATFSNSPDVLVEFGLKPNKPKTPLTVEQKAAASEKRKATRAARGTKGKRQLSGIKGDVTGVVVTPVTTAKPPVVTVTEGTSPAASDKAAGATATPPPHT